MADPKTFHDAHLAPDKCFFNLRKKEKKSHSIYKCPFESMANLVCKNLMLLFTRFDILFFFNSKDTRSSECIASLHFINFAIWFRSCSNKTSNKKYVFISD